MEWIIKYRLHLLVVAFALSFFWSLTMWSKNEIEADRLKVENLKLRMAYEELLNDYSQMQNRVEIHIYKFKDVEIARDTIQPNKPKKYDKFKFAPDIN